MSTPAEIKAADDALTPRIYSAGEPVPMLAGDEADMKRFRRTR